MSSKTALGKPGPPLGAFRRALARDSTTRADFSRRNAQGRCRCKAAVSSGLRVSRAGTPFLMATASSSRAKTWTWPTTATSMRGTPPDYQIALARRVRATQGGAAAPLGSGGGLVAVSARPRRSRCPRCGLGSRKSPRKSGDLRRVVWLFWSVSSSQG